MLDTHRRSEPVGSRQIPVGTHRWAPDGHLPRGPVHAPAPAPATPLASHTQTSVSPALPAHAVGTLDDVACRQSGARPRVNPCADARRHQCAGTSGNRVGGGLDAEAAAGAEPSMGGSEKSRTLTGRCDPAAITLPPVPPLVASGFDAEPTESQQFRAVLSFVLRPAILRDFAVGWTPWFDHAEWCLGQPLVCASVVAALFDDELLARHGHFRHEKWFAFAWRCLFGAAVLDVPARTRVPAAETPVRRPASFPRLVDREPITAADDGAPTGDRVEPLPVSPERLDEAPAQAERMLRLLPEVTRTITAGATSVEALATAVFTHLTGRAA